MSLKLLCEFCYEIMGCWTLDAQSKWCVYILGTNLSLFPGWVELPQGALVIWYGAEDGLAKTCSNMSPDLVCHTLAKESKKQIVPINTYCKKILPHVEI